MLRFFLRKLKNEDIKLKKLIFIVFFLLISSTGFSQWFWQRQSSGTNIPLEEVFFINNFTGWTVGYHGTILKTSNSGKNWISQNTGNYWLRDVFFINPDTGWIAGEYVILKTINGGINWFEVLYIEKSLNSVHFINQNTGWVSSVSVILKTTNGGLNWINLFPDGTTWRSMSIQFADSNLGWIAADDEIRHSSDGGHNWIIQSSGIDQELRSVYFIDDKTGWAAGGLYASPFTSILLKTTNGGTNWNNSNIGTNNALYSVHFMNKNIGWIAGINGTTLQTLNSGHSWNNQTSGTSEWLYSIFTTDTNFVWAVGSNGIILSRMNINNVHDVGVTSIIEPVSNSYSYLDCDSSIILNPKCTIKNFGINNESNFFDIKFEIRLNNIVVYSDVRQDTVSAGQAHTINFDPFTVPANSSGEIDNYKVKVWANLATETNVFNDTLKSEFYSSNPNYRYTYFGNPYYYGYYFLNSSVNANCIPEQSVYNWEDTTGSVSLISNAQTIIPYTEYNGFYFCGSFRLPDVLPSGKKFRFFNSCYDTIIIANNGIIGFGNTSLSRMNIPTPISIPSVNAPRPAIFPLWYRVNFQDPEITGRNLKYKITDDKFIITYDRAPLYNTTIDANDYVTYQVVLEIVDECASENGKIKILYNYDNCGSTFINHYNDNALNALTVGIQNSTGTIGLQYRRSETDHTLTVPGYLFGSPLAVEFAPLNSVLPVELESFSSSVNKNNVNLVWVVNSQINNSGFDIERKKLNDQASDDWINAGSVAGDGSVNISKLYSFSDRNLTTGKYAYRLKQIDFNGSFKYYDLQNEIVIGVPLKFKLSQNYPNPFNPVTKIDYNIAVESKVNLVIYDAVGRLVKTIVNEFKPAGYYSVYFNGADLSSGVYFYRLETTGFTEAKKLMLLK